MAWIYCADGNDYRCLCDERLDKSSDNDALIDTLIKTNMN